MNIIQKQAAEFYRLNMRESRTKHPEFVIEVKTALIDYRRPSHKLEFLGWILSKLKIDYDKHFETCKSRENCVTNETYENSIFFLQIEQEQIEESLNPQDFSGIEKTEMDRKLNEILDRIKQLQLGQQVIYDDLQSSLDELKELYYLNKKTWGQLLLGKLTDFTAAGLVAEEISTPLLELMKQYKQVLHTT